MRRLPAVLALILVTAPVLIAPSGAVVALGVLALLLCGLGILVAAPLLVGGMVLALGEYALALELAGGAPRLAGAALLGVVLLLLLETADFAGRAHHAAIGPNVLRAQVRSWATFGALTGGGTLVTSAAAVAAGATLRLPWAAGIAAASAAIALVAIGLALRGARARWPD